MGGSVAQGAGGGGGGSRRRRGRGRRGGAKPMSEINVTPFVDVMMCLLIIFMVAAPLMTVGVPIDLPDTSAEALPNEEEEPLTVTLAVDGTVSLQTTEISREDLIPRLQAIAAERDSPRIFVRADGAIPYTQVMEIMGALNAGGFRQIGLVTDSGGPRLDGNGLTGTGR